MTIISFDVPNAKLPEFIQAFCENFDYEASKREGETEAQFAKRMWAQLAVDLHRGWRVANARREAEATEQSNPDIEIT